MATIFRSDGTEIEVQDKLVSGQNIKTVNGKSLLGSGNIVVEGGEGGGGVSVDEQQAIMGSPHIYLSSAVTSANLDAWVCTDIYDLYDALVSAHPDFFVRNTDLGSDQSGDHMLRHYTMRMQSPYVSRSYKPYDSSTNNYNRATMSPRTILINSGIHGDEKSSVYGTYLAIKAILESSEEWAVFIRTNFCLEICPIANPWGFNNNVRPNSADVNLNRDFFSETPQAETTCLKNLIASCYNLHAVLDSHNTTFTTTPHSGSVPYAYLCSMAAFNFHPYYCRVATMLASANFSRLDTLFKNAGLGNQKPYICVWLSPNRGTFMDYVNTGLNLLGGTVESLSGQGANPLNNAKWSEVTQYMLINLIQIYGCKEYDKSNSVVSA